MGSSPFPAEKPVFLDERGLERSALPETPEPARLLFLDFPWCPQCDDMWQGMNAAAQAFPPGTLRVYRILFDRERLFTRGEPADVPPLLPTSPRNPVLVDSAGNAVPVTTWTAIPVRFRDRFQVGQVPILLLLDREGVVAARWVGVSPSLAASLTDEIRERSAAPPSSGR